ncbi:hypothetical protein BCV72DRAFT_335892 [Rhizopus microsporus var. microsporus]|uniref:EF-hand n=2 Tax=Rhizopus microsporus TaxID=58291 RepID=A0A2G4SR98_RHIZD|nr:uncharacterized protein RHIMIDRAFT_257257 [Rhizopus microsporus ATCC 52813]ORE06422.1 hypothetical protein BCV72DRAFT_335892 [Rhizopus microsporus var. microsporus]PHZ11294.1 hypothetical protein RHIMIDRAFT_257257 [Rhizopus microsporus ATCC 52813]
MSTTNTWESSLTPTEVTTYKQLFKAAALTQPNMVTGLEAVQFFARSELPNTVLSEIWETADEQNLGYLTPDTFAVALKLIACAQNHIKPKSPLLSTPTPLPRIKGIQLTPESDHALITPAERMKYQSIYKAQHPTDFGIQAEAAKNLFLKSKLPNDQLAQIWNLADIRRCGYLNESEFIIAMHYIAKLMDKSMIELPAVLPQSVYLSALGQQSVSSPSSQRAGSMSSTISNVDLLVSSQDKARYESYFNKLDRQGRGIIQRPDAFEFFKRSKLPDTELVHIWNMVDKDGKQTLNSTQFAAAMHLIHSKLSGQSIMSPTISPPVMTASPQMISQAIPVKEEEDLLGEDNQELAEETNKVNLLQNQIETTKKATRDLQAQRSRIEQSLSALKEKNTDLRHQQEELQSKNESESMQLQQLKETLSHESPTWERVKAEFESAEKDLELLKKQKDEVQNELKQGQNENERLRRSVHNIQMETLRFTKQLDELQEKHKRKQERAAAKKAALEKAEAERIAAEQKRKREEEERQRIEKQEEEERQRAERERQEEEERQRVEKQKEEERQRIEKQKEEERQREEKKRQSQSGPEEDGGHMEKERQMTDERRPSQEQGLSRSDHEKEPEIVGQTEEIARPVSESIKDDIPHEQPSTKSELTQDQTELENSLPQGSKGEEITENSISNLEQIVPDKDNKEQEIQQAQLAQYTDKSKPKENEEIKDAAKDDATDRITPIEAEAAIIAPERNEQDDKEEQMTHDRDEPIIKPHNEDNETGKTLGMNPFKESGISQDSNVSVGHTRQPDYLADTEGEATDSADDFYDAVENGDSNLIKSALTSRKQDTRTSSADESEFVMIDHPDNNGPSVRSKEMTKRPEALESTKSSELLGRIERKEGEKRSKNKEEEEEPVMISSLSESDGSDTNARTVAPFEQLNQTNDIMKQSSSKANQSPESSMFDVTKYDQTVSTAPLIDSNEFDSIFGNKQNGPNSNHDNFDDSFLKGDTVRDNLNENDNHPTSLASDKLNTQLPMLEDIPETKENAPEQTKSDIDLSQVHEHAGFLHNNSTETNPGEHGRGWDETPPKETVPEIDNSNKKKKKKGIMKWAKTLGGFDGENKKKKKKKADKEAQQQNKNSSSSTNTQGIITQTSPSEHKQPTFMQHAAPSITPSTASNNYDNVNAYNLDTIQGSRIAELVNMGFDPTAAKEALDRYDQDLEKATNYLLDQS